MALTQKKTCTNAIKCGYNYVIESITCAPLSNPIFAAMFGLPVAFVGTGPRFSLWFLNRGIFSAEIIQTDSYNTLKTL